MKTETVKLHYCKSDYNEETFGVTAKFSINKETYHTLADMFPDERKKFLLTYLMLESMKENSESS